MEKQKLSFFPSLYFFFNENWVLPRKISFHENNFFLINEKTRLISKFLTKLGPPFSYLWQKHELAIRPKRVELSVQVKGRARQNSIHLSRESFWGHHRLCVLYSAAWEHAKPCGGSLTSTPPGLDAFLSTAEEKFAVLYEAQHQLLVLAFTSYVGGESMSSKWEKTVNFNIGLKET